MESKEKFLKALQRRLSPSQKQLFTMITVESRKESLVFRMPISFISLQGVWSEIEKLAEEMKIKVSKAGVFATLDELDDILGDIKWLWEGWIPKGFVTMVVGDPGIGKSAIVQHFVKIVTEGACFPLCSEELGEPADVVWVDTEAAQQILKVRADSMKINKKRVFIPVIDGDLLAQSNLGDGQHRENIIAMIEGTEPTMLVLDSLGGSHARGENKVEEIRPVMEFLATIARDYQIAVVVIHHLNKERKDEAAEISLYRVRGSTVITGYCRSIFALEKSVGRNIKMNMIKSNLYVIGEPITAIPTLDENKNFTGFQFEPYLAPPSKKNKKEFCAEWILETLSKDKDGSMALTELLELGSLSGYTRATIYATKDTLGDRVVYSGTGNKSFWSIVRGDTSTMKKILSNGKNGKVKHAGKK